MPRRIDAGEVLAALGGALVFVALFLEWFGELGFSGWEAFEALDLVIAVLALAAVVAAVSSMAGSASGPSPRVLPWLGAVLLAIVAVQLIEPPPIVEAFEAEGGGGAEREIGGWLALAGSGLVFLGGLLRAARISVTVSVGARDVRRRVPAVDRRGASSSAAPAGAAPGAGGIGGSGARDAEVAADAAADPAARRSAADPAARPSAADPAERPSAADPAARPSAADPAERRSPGDDQPTQAFAPTEER